MSGGEQPPSPLAPSGPSLTDWRLTRLEDSVNALQLWREIVGPELQAMKGSIAENTRRLNQIALVTTGTLVSVLAGLAIYILTGGHH